VTIEVVLSPSSVNWTISRLCAKVRLILSGEDPTSEDYQSLTRNSPCTSLDDRGKLSMVEVASCHSRQTCSRDIGTANPKDRRWRTASPLGNRQAHWPTGSAISTFPSNSSPGSTWLPAGAGPRLVLRPNVNLDQWIEQRSSAAIGVEAVSLKTSSRVCGTPSGCSRSYPVSR
jgi:hypothetical protein